MKIKSPGKDNVSDILNMIVEFTNRREKQLSENIINVNTKGYKPQDLDVSGFTYLMSLALSEHLVSERLVLQDSTTVKFGSNGTFQAVPQIDVKSNQLLSSNKKQYLKAQLKKMAENIINRKSAVQMIEQKSNNGTRLNA